LSCPGADVDARDRQGCTALIVAAQWGQADAAAYLVKVGADVRIFDRHDDSALHWASYKGNLEIVGLGAGNSQLHRLVSRPFPTRFG